MIPVSSSDNKTVRRDLTILFGILLCLSGCQKQPGPDIRFLQEGITFDANAGSGSVEYVANRPWTVAADAPWCRIIPSSGTGTDAPQGQLHLMVEENQSTDQRSCTITLASEDLSATLRVTQRHRDGFLLPESAFELGPENQSFRVPVWRVNPYQAEVVGDAANWIHLSGTKAMQEDGLLLSIDENPSVSRTGQIRIFSNGQEALVTIKQKSGYVKFDDPALEQYCRRFDSDHDNHLTIEEAQAVRGEIFLSPDVVSLTGLEHFIHLSSVICHAPLDLLDLRNFQNLTKLNVVGDLKKLLVSDLAFLCDIDIRDSEIKSLDLSGCRRLVDVNLGNNEELQAIDLTDCLALTTFRLWGSPLTRKMEFHDFPALQDLTVAGIKKIIQLNLKNLPKLTRVCCYNDPSLKELLIEQCPAVEILACYETALSKLDLSGTPRLKTLGAYDSALTSLDLSGLDQLKEVEVYQNPLKSLDLSGCSELTLLNCGGSRIQSLDVSSCTKLQTLYVESARLSSLSIKNSHSLKELLCGENPMTSLDLSGCDQLGILAFNNTLLTSVDLTTNLKIWKVDAQENPYLKTIYLSSERNYDDIIFYYDGWITELVYR